MKPFHPHKLATLLLGADWIQRSPEHTLIMLPTAQAQEVKDLAIIINTQSRKQHKKEVTEQIRAWMKQNNHTDKTLAKALNINWHTIRSMMKPAHPMRAEPLLYAIHEKWPKQLKVETTEPITHMAEEPQILSQLQSYNRKIKISKNNKKSI